MPKRVGVAAGKGRAAGRSDSSRGGALVFAAAHTRRTAHPGRASARHGACFGAAAPVSGEGGQLLLQMRGTALGALRTIGVGGTHQLLKARSAVCATIFENWHKLLENGNY